MVYFKVTIIIKLKFTCFIPFSFSSFHVKEPYSFQWKEEMSLEQRMSGEERDGWDHQKSLSNFNKCFTRKMNVDMLT